MVDVELLDFLNVMLGVYCVATGLCGRLHELYQSVAHYDIFTQYLLTRAGHERTNESDAANI